MRTSRSLRVLRIALIAAACGAVALVDAAPQRGAAGQAAAGYRTPAADAGRRVEASHGVVASANALASDAGLAMLKAGGNAVDAAVATAFAIGVVEPQMSGLGAGGVATVWMQREGKPAVLDFYSAQPADAWRGHTAAAPAGGRGAAASQDPAAQSEAAADLRVVAVPGDVAGLLALHKRYGTLPLATLVEPAIRLAEDGFPVGQMLSSFIASETAKLKRFPKAYALMFPNGTALGAGEILKNPELAASLRRVASQGRDGFYTGPTAEAMVSVLNAGGHPVRLSDLPGFEPQWKRPLCTDYRGQTVLSVPPPETGMQVLHTLELLEPFDLKALGLPTESAASFDVLVSAMRAAQTVARGNDDPNWVPVPARGVSSAAYAASRKALVGTGHAVASMTSADASAFDTAAAPGACSQYDPYGPAQAIPGVPAPAKGFAATPSDDGNRRSEESGETTHISVVDKDGNAVALTQTNSSVFGSGGYSAGFFLNDSGFRFTDANIDAPSKSRWRIRTTTIAPTIVLRDGRVHMVIGAPGAGRIPTEVLQVMVYTLDLGLDPLDAVKIPRIYPSAASTRVQLAHGFSPQILKEIRDRGYDPVDGSSGYARLYMIVRRGNVWVGVADPQHDGQPRGY